MRDLVRGDGDSEPADKPPPRAEPAPAAAPPAARERLRLAEVAAQRQVGTPPPPAEDPDALFAAVLDATGRLRDVVKRGERLPMADLEVLVGRVVRSLEQGSELFWLANELPRPDVDPVAAHLASVGVQSVRIGADLGYDRPQLADLGLAGFLFDVGLWQLPDRLLDKTGPLTVEEQALYQTHPRLSADLLRQAGVERAGLVEVALAHHEREQGQGYPQGLPGSAIHPHARIIGLMDTYARLTGERPPRPRLMPHEAIREIVRSKHESFPSTLIKALLSEISVFPPRTMVRLNTGEVGRVVAVNRNHPLRPRVEVLADSKGERLASPKLVDLSEAPFLYITGPLAEPAQ
jgi:HD-GYP domain-containing protein (c-di-GMP phosphodiesterase class II)